MSKRNQDVLWVDKEFKKKLEKIKAERLLNDIPVGNLGNLTREMLECPSFPNIEKELVEVKKAKVRIALDKKRLFG